MIRFMFLSHRYLGIAVGWLMALWCVSGIVMMYVSYPKLNEGERLSLLPALSDFKQPSTWPSLKIHDAEKIHGLSLEIKENAPHIIAQFSGRKLQTFSFTNPSALPEFNAAHAQREAAYYAENITNIQQIDYDQWTVYSSYRPHRPLYKLITQDDAGTELYVSSKTGQLIQQTTQYQRFWNYLGAITHWLYPTFLRQHTTFWYYLVIVLSFIGALLCISGFYAGIKQLKRRRNGRLSPYRGVAWWHHWAGLSFGVLLFIWTVSGLLSMNPGGLLSSSGSKQTQNALGQLPLRWDHIQDQLHTMHWHKLPADTVKLELVPLNQTLYWLATTRDQQTHRMDRHLNPVPLQTNEIGELSQKIAAGKPFQLTWLSEEDTYYFAHHKPIQLPVWRLILDDDQQTRFYLSPDGGRIVKKIDRNGRLHRWLFDAAHRWDFSSVLRKRPIWDLVLVPILLLTTLFVGTGCWMGLKRLQMMRRKRVRQRTANA